MEKSSAVDRFTDRISECATRVLEDQRDALERAAGIFADAIGGQGSVHVFGSGHSRIMAEELFPRHGSFPGFHLMVELSMSNHTQVVGSNGQRQAMFIERVEGLGEVILSNFHLVPPDAMLVISNSGVTEVAVEVAQGARERGLPVVALVSREHAGAARPRHSSGATLLDVADVVLDNGAPIGDAAVAIDGADVHVGPLSSIGGCIAVNAVKIAVADRLVGRGQLPPVLTSAALVGDEESRRLFEAGYDDYRRRLRRAFGPDDV